MKSFIEYKEENINEQNETYQIYVDKKRCNVYKVIQQRHGSFMVIDLEDKRPKPVIFDEIPKQWKVLYL